MATPGICSTKSPRPWGDQMDEFFEFVKANEWVQLLIIVSGAIILFYHGAWKGRQIAHSKLPQWYKEVSADDADTNHKHRNYKSVEDSNE